MGATPKVMVRPLRPVSWPRLSTLRVSDSIGGHRHLTPGMTRRSVSVRLAPEQCSGGVENSRGNWAEAEGRVSNVASRCYPRTASASSDRRRDWGGGTDPRHPSALVLGRRGGKTRAVYQPLRRLPAAGKAGRQWCHRVRRRDRGPQNRVSRGTRGAPAEYDRHGSQTGRQDT